MLLPRYRACNASRHTPCRHFLATCSGRLFMRTLASTHAKYLAALILPHFNIDGVKARAPISFHARLGTDAQQYDDAAIITLIL